MMSAVLPFSADSDRSRLRILLADDNVMLRAALRGLIRSLGHTIDEATNGIEAVELASRREFDFVFLDIQMPGMGGLEAARCLLERSPDRLRPRIIGISGDSEDRQACQAAGMEGFLAKPVRLADLIHAMEPLLPLS